MNEQIKALAEQAGYNGSYATEDFSIEYFAESIVLECASVIQSLVDHRVPASEYSDRLKEHFGIE